MSEQKDSSVQADATVEADLNVPAGHQILYSRTGTRLIVAEQDVPAVMHDLGLITEKYDLADATAELLSRAEALGDTIHNTALEVTARGYIDEMLEGVVNAAVGDFRLAFDHWSRCIGALVPTEALVRDLAVHKARAGHLEALPSFSRHEQTADRYAAEHDLADHMAAEEEREAAEQAARGGTANGNA